MSVLEILHESLHRLLCLTFLLYAGGAAADGEIPLRTYESQRTETAPEIDGDLGDGVWDAVEWEGEFLQRDPMEGEAPSQATRFKALYDDQALYFAFYLEDDPAEVSGLLGRRDTFPGDWIEVNIGSYGDRRTAFSFTLSRSGVRGDEFISEDGRRWDSNWDPVWSGDARGVPDGWTAEMRIPLSQLRFSDLPEQAWGLQVQRRVHRLEERSVWQPIPRDSEGWVSRFGELRGLRNLRPKRNIALWPYVVADTSRFPSEPGNPFRDGGDSRFDGGLDGKVGITNNLTLDLTVNPDFGQVEADPSEVNLTAFETFFQERRPFFVEGQDIFQMPVAPAQTGGPFAFDRLFYSRRIGRAPALFPDLRQGELADVPRSTTILGAFKLSGKTSKGLSIGVLESVTAEETARLALGEERGSQVVEPLTNYFVARLRKDYRGGDTQVGGMLTAVNRRLEDTHSESGLASGAYAGGLDLSHYFADRDYRLEMSVFGSRLEGSRESILAVQRASARFFQRPDNRQARLDPQRTSLSGHAGSLRLTRTNNHRLVFQTGVAWRSPGFELNDLGFLRSADGIDQFTWVAYQQRQPMGRFDHFNLNFNQRFAWDYGGNYLGANWNVNGNGRLRNKWFLGASLSRSSDRVSNTELRGGPSSKWPGSWFAEAWVNTDNRRRWSVQLGTSRLRGDESSESVDSSWFTLQLRPRDALSLSVSLRHTLGERLRQYIGTRSVVDPSGEVPRYLFGTLDQKTTQLTLRLDYTITPDLTVQLYAAPFVSSGRYDDFQRVVNPRAARFGDRFNPLITQPTEDGFGVDEDGDGATDYRFSDPDFDVREFNANLVVRWEYRPGSAVFVVWSQVRDASILFGDDPGFDRQLDRLFEGPAEDVFLLKVSQRFSL